jgi:hypothetical protein
MGLFGCPQLLDDDFATGRLSEPDAGVCVGSTCGVSHSGTGGSAGSAGSAGSDAGSDSWGGSGDWGGYGSGGSSGDWGGYGSWGNSGSAGSSAGSAGTGGTSGAAGTAGTAGSAGSGSADPCRTFELTDDTQDGSSNCVGIVGWNQVQVLSPTTLSLSYQDGNPCFTGTIATSGYATYTMTLADPEGSTWDATTHGVSGFEFSSSGANQIASLQVLYKDPSGVDFCRVIGPGDTAVPFSDAHPNCSNNASSGVADATALTDIIFKFPVNNQSYPVDFCMQITALE